MLDSYRTTLTGLNQDEVRALFMLSIPAPLAELGVDQELKAALLKLSAALPTTRRPDEEQARQRIHLDSAGWSETIEPVPHLQAIHQAVWQDRKLHVTFRLPFDTLAEWLVEPYGLVAKAGSWYLVCARDGPVRVHRISQLQDAYLSESLFERPADFDLVAFWRDWCARVEENRPTYPVRIRVTPDLIPWLPYIFGASARDALTQSTPPDAEGWISLVLSFDSLEDARDHILKLGRAAKVLEPKALRDSVLDYAIQIVEKLNLKPYICEYLLHKALLYDAMGKAEKAIDVNNRALAIASEIGKGEIEVAARELYKKLLDKRVK